jgi:hypothetical protein
VSSKPVFLNFVLGLGLQPDKSTPFGASKGDGGNIYGFSKAYFLVNNLAVNLRNNRNIFLNEQKTTASGFIIKRVISNQVLDTHYNI